MNDCERPTPGKTVELEEFQLACVDTYPSARFWGFMGEKMGTHNTTLSIQIRLL